MKKLLFLAALLACTSTAQLALAQDAKSTPIVQSLNEKLKKSKAIKANFFTLYNNAKGETKAKLEGKLTIKGNKYIIDMGSHIIYNNGTKVYTHLVDAKEVQVSDYDPASDPISPALLFSGDFTSDFNYSYKGERTISGRKVHIIELLPKKPNKAYTRLELFVDVATSTVSGGNLFEKNGSYYSIAISNLDMNANTPDSAFTLDTKSLAGVEVIHLN